MTAGARGGRRRRGVRLPSSAVAAGVTTMVLFTLYLATAAPDLTFWDASELTTAAHTLGIPHPPGTPLWVLLGHVCALVFQSVNPARAITMLSVVAGALTGGVGAWLATRWVGARGAVVSAVLAGSFYTVWNNATETEVYAVTLLASVLLLLVAERAGRADIDETQRRRLRGVMAFVVGLAIPLHLSVWVALPAAVAFAWPGVRRGEASSSDRTEGRSSQSHASTGVRPGRGELVGWVLLALLGASAVMAMPLMAMHDPALNSGNPVTLDAVLAVLRREQYQVAGMWPRQAPLWLQFGNVLQWADWQVGFGVQPRPVPSLARTGLTVLFVWLAILGVRRLWRHEARVGRAMLLLVLSASFGVVVWLNMRLGPTYGGDLIPANAIHEARERDYFFALAFWAWGMLAGVGLTAVSAALRRARPSGVSIDRVIDRVIDSLAMLPLLAAAIPMVVNRAVIDRTREPAATMPRTYARLLLDAVPQHGVLVAAGDNDTFPLWYLQQVEDYRADVTVVTVPLLGAEWYRAQLAGQELLGRDAVQVWPGLSVALRSVMAHAERGQRPVRVSTLLERHERLRLDPTRGWALEGLVYAPSEQLAPGATGLDLAAMQRSRDATPRSALAPLPAGADAAQQTTQELLRCNTIERLTDSLLVSGCNGF
ncbi:DUF2723 domain-containing protein [Gemmatimonas aurantiaca]|uniref:protein O-mannosyl-transferase family n=1 Tax=Gemmatimonas aurantiaca TaxID=173480 RepID=UPI00301D2840